MTDLMGVIIIFTVFAYGGYQRDETTVVTDDPTIVNDVMRECLGKQGVFHQEIDRGLYLLKCTTGEVT